MLLTVARLVIPQVCGQDLLTVSCQEERLYLTAEERRFYTRVKELTEASKSWDSKWQSFA